MTTGPAEPTYLRSSEEEIQRGTYWRGSKDRISLPDTDSVDEGARKGYPRPDQRDDPVTPPQAGPMPIGTVGC
jgi:hypothetical protein